MAALEEMFRDMFTRMKVGGTDELVARFTEAPVIPVPVPAALAKALSR
jgi:hypothetical protein